MDQRATPLPLLTTAELRAWINVSPRWIKDRLADPEFVSRCVIDLAPEGSTKRTLRYAQHAVAEYLRIPLPPEPPQVTSRSGRKAA